MTKLFGRRWWWTTLLVLAGVAVLIRLGVWQLDRLQQRREFNIMVSTRWKQEPYDITQYGLPGDLSELEFRRVEASGQFDYANQMILKEQIRNQAPGVVLITPLLLEDDRAVLVARGWIPLNQSTSEFWPQFEEPPGAAVTGLIQESQLLPSGEAPAIPESAQSEWFRINIDAIQPQLPYELLPVFILQLPDADRPYDALPLRDEPLTLNEGSHFSYAIQWFMFALILGVGYIFFVRHMEAREQRVSAMSDAATGCHRAGDPKHAAARESCLGGMIPIRDVRLCLWNVRGPVKVRSHFGRCNYVAQW